MLAISFLASIVKVDFEIDFNLKLLNFTHVKLTFYSLTSSPLIMIINLYSTDIRFRL